MCMASSYSDKLSTLEIVIGNPRATSDLIASRKGQPVMTVSIRDCKTMSDKTIIIERRIPKAKA